MSLEQLASLLSRYNRKRNYYRLKSGQFVTMEESSLDTLAQLSQGLILTEEQLASGISPCQNSVPYIWMHSCGMMNPSQ